MEDSFENCVSSAVEASVSQRRQSVTMSRRASLVIRHFASAGRVDDEDVVRAVVMVEGDEAAIGRPDVER